MQLILTDEFRLIVLAWMGLIAIIFSSATLLFFGLVQARMTWCWSRKILPRDWLLMLSGLLFALMAYKLGGVLLL